MNEELKRVLEEMRSTHQSFKNEVGSKIEEIRKNGHASAETEATLAKINADLTELRSQYEELVKATQRPGSDDPSTAAIEENKELRSAFVKFLRYGSGENGRTNMTQEEQRALSSSADVDGGFLIPTSFESELITLAFNDAEIRPLCDAAPTGRDAVQLAAISKPVIAWGNRNLAVPPQDLSVGSERIEIFDLKALTLIANNTLEDSEADVWGELLKQFSMAIAEAEDDAFAIAPGSNSPQGILADPRVLANVTNTGVATALSDGTNNGVDALIRMLQSLKKTYRRNSTWAMNSKVEGELRQLKDSNGQFLWQPPVLAGNPATFLGRPLINPEGFPDTVANSFPIVLGDFRKGYKIRDRSGVAVQRLVERYAEFDQTGFIVKKRIGGQVVLPEAFAVLKVSV